MKKTPIEISMFNRVLMEADGEDNTEGTNVKVVPRNNRGTDYNDDGESVTVTPRSNRGTDYNNDDSEDDSSSDDNSSDSGDDEPTDYNDDSSNDDNSGDNNSDDSGNGDSDSDNDTGDESSDDDGDDEPTDYNDDSSDNNNSEDSNDSNNDSSNNNEDNATKEKRYFTYRRFVYLYNSIDSFIEKLRNVVKSDPIENRVIQIVIDNLTNIHDNMFDYMTSKFKNASYVQILVYFETIISVIQLNFELLRNNRINLKQ